MNYDKIGVLFELKSEIVKTLYLDTTAIHHEAFYSALEEVLKLINNKIQTIMNTEAIQ